MRRKKGNRRFPAARKRSNRTTFFVLGDWNVVDDVTGFVRKRSECRFTWDNLLVARDQWDPKQPQLDLRGRRDKQAIPDARPDRDPVFGTFPDLYVDQEYWVIGYVVNP